MGSIERDTARLKGLKGEQFMRLSRELEERRRQELEKNGPAIVYMVYAREADGRRRITGHQSCRLAVALQKARGYGLAGEVHPEPESADLTRRIQEHKVYAFTHLEDYAQLGYQTPPSPGLTPEGGGYHICSNCARVFQSMEGPARSSHGEVRCPPCLQLDPIVLLELRAQHTDDDAYRDAVAREAELEELQ